MFGGVMRVIDDHFLKERTLWYGVEKTCSERSAVQD
jgi:hypothetical protein